VQFYEDAAHLGARAASFLADALAAGGAAAAIATPVHLDAITRELHARGFDLDVMIDEGRLALLDAEATLASLMEGGRPDPARARAMIGPLVARLRASSSLRIYDEMVDLLSSRGEIEALLALERLWHELVAEHAFELLCGYRVRAAGDARNASMVDAICARYDTTGPSPLGTAGQAIAHLEERARVLETEVAIRARIERRMEELLAISGELAGARTRAEVARITIARLVPALGACDGMLWELADGQLRMLGRALPNETTRNLVVDIDRDAPVTRAIRDNEPIFIGSWAEYRDRFPDSYMHARSQLPYEEAALAALPVIADGAAVGGIVFTYDHARDFRPSDRTFKVLVARHCALALERVHLLDEEQALRRSAEEAVAHEKQARGDVELFYELVDALNRVDDLADAFALALAAVERGARSDRAAVLLFDADGVMRFKASHGLSDAYRAAVEGHSPWSPDARDPAPVRVDDVATDPAWEPYRELFRAEHIAALAFVPLVHYGRLIGKLMLYRNEPRPFTDRDLQLSATIAVHVAQAVERRRAEQEIDRAYREERDAHLEAEAATRAREEILSVVSHDLRNPLGAIMMGSSALLNIDVGDKSQRVRTTAERIHRQAERMARLIEDLVDFAGIQAGQLAIAASEHAPEEIVVATSDLFGPLAHERGLRLEARTAAGLPAIRCDSDRAVQVMSNLVANAIKVTPPGGAISIGAERGGAGPHDVPVVFYVHDTGPGIDPEELPILFERYFRSKKAQYKGTGLGLSIARGIVDAHGGKIWAVSEPGSGSTFYFSLSPEPAN
jgi:signal transduction histidine kinase